MRVLLSQRLVKVSAEDRLNDVSEQIAASRASHCVVLEQPGGEFLGIVRVRDAATLPLGRIFADLISSVPTIRVAKSLPANRLVQLVDRENLEDAVVLSNSGKFVGLVTRESLCDWQLKERVRAQSTIKQRAIDQDRLVARLSQKVRSQATALQQAIVQLEEVSYALSHDVRTPLRAVRGYAMALLDDHGPRLDEAANGYVRRIIFASDRLDRLTMGVLSYTQVSVRKIALCRVNLGRIVAQVVAEKKQTAPLAEIRVENLSNKVRGSRKLLSECVAQLIDNSLKFCPNDRTPVIRIWAERVGSDTRLWVQDNGLGVRPAHCARIFHLFEKIYEESAYAGMGVGLAIVRRAMERMHGQVGVEIPAEGGSRFWLQLKSG